MLMELCNTSQSGMQIPGPSLAGEAVPFSVTKPD